MKIIDINGREREAISIKKVSYPIRNAINGDSLGTQEFVEVVILGKTGRTWTEWYPLQEFMALNPKIVIENVNNI